MTLASHTEFTYKKRIMIAVTFYDLYSVINLSFTIFRDSWDKNAKAIVLRKYQGWGLWKGLNHAGYGRAYSEYYMV